jgi:hypothetical protein
LAKQIGVPASRDKEAAVGRLGVLKNLSLKTQFTLFFVFFVVAIYAVVLVITFQQITGITRTISSDLGIPIVEEAAAHIDGDAFEALSRSLDPADPYYEKARMELLALKEETNCIYLYTMAPSEGNVFRYIIDGSAPPEDTKHFSPLGLEEDISNYVKPIVRAMETKATQISSIDFNAQWGWTISTYTPILNSRGEAVGFAGCDFRADIYSRLWSQILIELIVSGCFVALGFAAYLYLVTGMDKQNRRLRELKEAAETASMALKDERDTIAAMKDALKVGLFFMDKDFIIHDHYSRALEEILSLRGLGGRKFTELLSGQIKADRLKNLIEYFVLIFNRSKITSHALSGKMLENLNPLQEMSYICPETGEEKILHCTFVPVDRGNGRLFILGNLQDVTGEKKLQKQLVDEAAKNREEIGRLRDTIAKLKALSQNESTPGYRINA